MLGAPVGGWLTGEGTEACDDDVVTVHPLTVLGASETWDGGGPNLAAV